MKLEERQETLTEKLNKLKNSLRPGQKSLAEWEGGEMAVSAVPGAGKSHSLAIAATIAIAKHQLHTRKQLVVVTYTRSAAAAIKKKIRDRLRDLGLSGGSFAVYTLHGLALHIATRYPNLSQLNLEISTLINPNSNHKIIRTCVEKWIAKNPVRYQKLLQGKQFDGEDTERLRRQSVLRTEVLPSLADTAIKEAKSSDLSPEDLWQLSKQTPDEYEILAIAAGLYEQYQRLIRERNFYDYDDMILAALKVLKDPIVRQIWQKQVFAVFEDEAQDSSPLQEELLRTLAADPKDEKKFNLVRVGDPNQAINSTFTPADPIYFNRFCDNCQKKGNLSTMNMAGRSSKIIIDSANFTIEWVNRETRKKEPDFSELELPFRDQDIIPVPPEDPQPNANPEATGTGIEIHLPEDIDRTVDLIEARIIQLFAENRDRNCAILVRENKQARFLAEQLAHLKKKHEITIYEVGAIERYSHIPAEMLKIMQFLDRPHSPDYLKATLEILQNRGLISTQDLNALATCCEEFLYPGPLSPPQKPHVKQASRFCCQLLRARIELPQYQLITFLGMALKYGGTELATVEKLAERVFKQIIGNISLKNIIAVLEEIVSSEKFEGVAEEENEDRYTRNQQVTIITMHKAKGLDWDYVFIPFLHEDILPGKPWVPNAAKFLGDFTLAEVARGQIRAKVHSNYQNETKNIPQPDEAWAIAAKLKTAEEFRLLYVAMTRAKRLLWLSASQLGPFRWNTFRSDTGNNLQSKQPTPVLLALKNGKRGNKGANSLKSEVRG
ncbi:MAG: ATP-dependent helicase [Prochloraceae cyanobacterium]|nr:ATP-dependent helicase [Prochloraceae cyanobacterium]